MEVRALFIEGSAERVSEIGDKSIKLTYGSPPYPLIKRDYGYWTEEAWMNDMQRWMRALRPKMRDDGFIVINVKAGRIKAKAGECSERSMVVEDFVGWMRREMGVFVVDIDVWHKTNPATTGLRCATQDAYEQIVWFACSNPWEINLDDIRRPYSEETLKRYATQTFKPRANGNGYVRKEKRIEPNEKGALPLNVVTCAVSAARTSHQATQREELPERYILACTNPGELVWDMWLGTGTTARAAIRLGRIAGGTDVTLKYLDKSLIGHVA